MRDYEPHAGTLTARAVRYLREHAPHGSAIWISSSTLGYRLEASAATVATCLNTPRHHGLVLKGTAPDDSVGWQAGPAGVANKGDPMQNEPRPGSAGGKALAHIRAFGRTNAVALATAIDVSLSELDSLLAYPLRMGLLTRVLLDGVPHWDIGSGEPKQSQAEVQSAAAPSPQQQDRRQEVEIDSRRIHNNTMVPAPASEPRRPRQAMQATKARTFDCAMYDDGRLVIEVNGEAIIFSPDEALRLYMLQSRFASRPV